jgi:hypothetical protein
MSIVRLDVLTRVFCRTPTSAAAPATRTGFVERFDRGVVARIDLGPDRYSREAAFQSAQHWLADRRGAPSSPGRSSRRSRACLKGLRPRRRASLTALLRSLVSREARPSG